MADQWFYRMFGEEFGPMALEKLKELADGGTIQALDHVRSSSSQDWVAAANIDELGLSASERRTIPTMATTSLTDLEISMPPGNDEWYCELGGQELGPLSFDELLQYVEKEQLGADDQVKLGAQGKWRRVGSIGRLMAALPYQAVEKTIVPGALKPLGSSQPVEESVTAKDPSPAEVDVTYRLAYEQAKARVTESMLAQADAAFQAAEQQAQAQTAWTTAPNVDRHWWGWAGGGEFGPVEFAQVFGLAKSGQLKPSDFVRNGQFGQYVPAANVPGLLSAVEAIAKATEARNQARSQAAALAAPPIIPPAILLTTEKAAPAKQAAPARSNPMIPAVPVKPKSNPTMAAQQSRDGSDPQVDGRTQNLSDLPRMVERTPTAEPNPSTLRSPYASSMSSGFGTSGSSSSASSYRANRPVPIPIRPQARRNAASESTWFSDMLENMKQPKALGSAGAIAAVMLIFGWGYLPKSRGADIRRYQTLKGLVDEIRSKRASAPTELPSLQQKLEKAAKEISAEVKAQANREEPAKQCLLWATRDEIPRVIQAGLTTESPAEKTLLARLQDAAYELGLEKRPIVALAQSTSPVSDD